MMAEMFGKRTGYCKGLGGSMHIADLSLDISAATDRRRRDPARGGAGYSKLRGTGQAAVAFFGDGAAGRARARGMNLAATWELPVVFICENNQSRCRPTGGRSAPSRISPTAPPATGWRARSSTATTCSPSRTRSRARSTGRARRGPDAPRAEDVPPDAALDAREPPGRRDPALVEEWEAKDPLPRFERCSRARRARRRARRGCARGRARRRARVDAALADEDASADDLLPAVLGPQRSYPAPAAGRT